MKLIADKTDHATPCRIWTTTCYFSRVVVPVPTQQRNDWGDCVGGAPGGHF
ncbi:hypothetical protein OK016_17265 [Vibrio chagasii]|nr:hypothetical protein [Vibrio chagasii]